MKFSHTGSRSVVFFLIATILLAGCDESLTEPKSSDSQSSSATPNQTSSLPDLNPLVERLSPKEVSLHTTDARMAELARNYEGFAGFYRSKDGDPTILIADRSISSAVFLPLVVPELKTMLGRSFEKLLDKRQPVVRYVEHDFAKLKSWKDASANVFNVDGVLSLDLDERKNVITVGIESKDVRDEAMEKLRQLGLPSDGVVLEVEEPVQEEKTLQDTFRPTWAGIEISLGCTIGYNGEDSSGNLYFVTNSHCTQQRFGLDGEVTEQPWFGSRVGVEVGDPPVSGDYAGCPDGRRCRYSDAALIKYDPGIDARKFISRPKSKTSGGQEGDSDVRSTIDVITNYDPLTGSKRKIVQKVYRGSDGGSGVYVGQTLDRIGRTSGWTYGDVSETCVNVKKTGTDITMLCQARARYGSDGGDSGSPVFVPAGPAPPNYEFANLKGIHWGGYDNSPRAVFSTLNWVENEIGQLQIEGPNYPGNL